MERKAIRCFGYRHRRDQFTYPRCGSDRCENQASHLCSDNPRGKFSSLFGFCFAFFMCFLSSLSDSAGWQTWAVEETRSFVWRTGTGRRLGDKPERKSLILWIKCELVLRYDKMCSHMRTWKRWLRGRTTLWSARHWGNRRKLTASVEPQQSLTELSSRTISNSKM